MVTKTMEIATHENEIEETVESDYDMEDEIHSDDPSTSSDRDEEEEEGGKSGWADSMAKVLRTTKPQKKKSVVLSRARKLTQIVEVAKPKPLGFEIDGEVKEEKPSKETLDEQIASGKKPKNISLALRMKPSYKDIERERSLKKIGTRGVVQLFNAVRIQQKELDQQIKEAGPLDHKKDAVLNSINRRKFLDVLMSGKRAQSAKIDGEVKDEGKGGDDESDNEDGKTSEWSVLRDDFMTNKKMKNWDQEDESNESANEGGGGGDNSDSDSD